MCRVYKRIEKALEKQIADPDEGVLLDLSMRCAVYFSAHKGQITLILEGMH
jgi:hypothetical protein